MAAMPRGMAAIFYLDVCSHAYGCSGRRISAEGGPQRRPRGQRLQFVFRKMQKNTV